jgi:hypothetical protein
MGRCDDLCTLYNYLGKIFEAEKNDPHYAMYVVPGIEDDREFRRSDHPGPLLQLPSHIVPAPAHLPTARMRS